MSAIPAALPSLSNPMLVQVVQGELRCSHWDLRLKGLCLGGCCSLAGISGWMGCEVLGVSSWVTQAGIVRLGAGVGVGGLGVHTFLPLSIPAVSCPKSEGSRGGD